MAFLTAPPARADVILSIGAFKVKVALGERKKKTFSRFSDYPKQKKIKPFLYWNPYTWIRIKHLSEYGTYTDPDPKPYP